MILKYEIQLYKSFMIFKRRVFEINKTLVPNKIDALLNAYLIYDVSVQIVMFKDKFPYKDALCERHLKQLSERKTELIQQRKQIIEIEKEFKNANRK